MTKPLDTVGKSIYKALNAKIDKLEKENSRMWNLQEKVQTLSLKNINLEKALEIKRKVFRVIVVKDGSNYLLQLTKVNDTPEGLFIEGNL